MTSGAAAAGSMPLSAMEVWRSRTSVVWLASRSASSSPTQTMGMRPWARADLSLRLTLSSVSLKYWRRSLWPMSTWVTPRALSISGEVSPVQAPWFSQCISCAATRMGWLRAASTTAGSSVGEAQSTTSAWLWGAASGRNALMKATASSGVLYIFQLAAMSFLRGILFIFLSYDFRLELSAELGRHN